MKRLIYAAAFLASLVACSKEQGPVQANEQLNGRETVLATAKDFVAAGATRTAITQSGSNPPEFAWKDGDVIGVIPMNGKTVQSNYKIAEIGSDPKNATFEGGVWALKDGKEYAAYYPFKKESAISDESIEFSFLGQRQDANNSLEHLGDYDYMYASAVVSQSGSAKFEFEHKISLVRLQLTVPADTYTKVALESSASWFASKASLKLSDGTMTAIETVKSVTINLNDIVVVEGNVLTVWFAALPTTALSGQTLSVKLFGESGNAAGEIAVKNELTAGKFYPYAATLTSIGKEVEYVDLGLSVKWASCNLGASSPEEYGGYYQWAGLQDVTDTGIYLDWSNCPYHTGSSDSTGWTKYIPLKKPSYWSGPGSPDNKTVLDPEDDAAYVNLGGKWRMPTDAEWAELINKDNCNWTWTTQNGVNGYRVTSNKSGYTNQSIFLPAAGRRYGPDLKNVSVRCDYWSSSLSTGAPRSAYYVYFRQDDDINLANYYRYYGRSVRPVYGDKVSVTGISLSPTSLSLGVGAAFTLRDIGTPSNAAEQSVSWSSSDPSVAKVDASGKVTALKVGSATITVTTTDGGYTATCSVTVVTPEAVDLGLPSGLKWASFNLGASKPEEYGGYYQWAGLQDVTDTNISLGWDNCPYHTGLDENTGWTKYIPSDKSSYWSGSGVPDNKTVLDPEDDVAHVALGGKWRMPTFDEFEELRNNCTSEWTTLNGINGLKFTSDKNGNSIFLPASGSRNGASLYNTGSRGYYWSSSFHTDIRLFASVYALGLYFNSGGVNPGSYYRCHGSSVRPVLK